MQVKAINLSFSYSKETRPLNTRALENINLTIDEGDFFGIIGATGSGKSTFVQHINGLIKVQKQSGKLFVGDFDLSQKGCDYIALRKRVGMVFQYPEYQLFAESIYLDIAFGVKNFYKDISKEELDQKVKFAMEAVGLDYLTYKDKSPFELSGGLKRRVAIAGVIIMRPEILVLDEPVAGLDPVGKREFIALLKELKKDFVKTIIIVSHDMNLIAENCNRVAVFSMGKVSKCGTPKEIFSDNDIVFNSGLDLPITAFATQKLKENGIDINSDFTIDSFVNSVAKKLGVK